MPELERTGVQGVSPRTRAEVHLDCVAANVRQLVRHVGPLVDLMAVVKADAYGHGAVPVARTALDHGAKRIAVFTIDEALALRHGGIAAPVLVLGPSDESAAPLFITHGITPAINNLGLARALSYYAATAGVDLPYHVEVDTGLTRNGLLPVETGAFLDAISDLPALRREGVFTHFASADEVDKSLTWRQFDIFNATVRDLAAAGFGFPIRHVANSAATLDLPSMHINMVRAGIALYGYYPSAAVGRPIPLQPVMTLVSRLARVRHIGPGEGVSYGHEYRTEKEGVIGLVPFGYADGMPRSVQGKGFVLVHGRRAPVVGRIAMDQFMVDLTEIPSVVEGDQVVILGSSGNETITADDIAGWAGTISYAILTGIGSRVPRLFVDSGHPVAFRAAMSSDITWFHHSPGVTPGDVHGKIHK